MSKTPRFLLATNTKATDTHYILHAGKQPFLAQVYKFDTEEERATFHAQRMEECEASGFPFLGGQTRHAEKGYYYYFSVIEIYGPVPGTQDAADKVAKKMTRMSDWYVFNVLDK